MEKSTVITLLIVVGLGGLALWLFLSDSSSSTPGAQPVPDSCGSGVFGGIGSFIKGHVDRKNNVAPLVAQKYGVPAQSAGQLTAIAGKLSPSNWVEGKIGNTVGDWFCKASLGWNDVETWATGVHSSATNFGKSNLAAGTVGPVKSLYSAGDNLVHGNFGDAGKDIAKSVYEGPKAAYDTTKDLAKAIIPGW